MVGFFFVWFFSFGATRKLVAVLGFGVYETRGKEGVIDEEWNVLYVRGRVHCDDQQCRYAGRSISLSFVGGLSEVLSPRKCEDKEISLRSRLVFFAYCLLLNFDMSSR